MKIKIGADWFNLWSNRESVLFLEIAGWADEFLGLHCYFLVLSLFNFSVIIRAEVRK